MTTKKLVAMLALTLPLTLALNACGGGSSGGGGGGTQATVPAAPTGLAATAGSASVSLSWTASSGAASYNVYRGTTSGGESATAIASGVTGGSYTDTGLTNGTTCYYKVAAVNGAGTSGFSNEASATPEPAAPAAPTGLTATAGSASVSLSWAASSGAASYNVYRGTTSGGESATAISSGIAATAYTDTAVTNGAKYYYKVAAVNGGGTSGLSNEASATPEPAAPAAPTGLTATAGSASVSLTWTASAGATSYNVYRGATSGGESATAIASGITTTAYTDSAVTNGTKYYYKVAAVNGGGTSGFSNEASATPQSVALATCGGVSLGDEASLNGFVPFPSTYAWNTNIASAPLDPNNTAITTAAGFAGLHLHHDFSSVAGGDYGIPYVVVDSSSTPLVPIDVVAYADQSDVAYAPFPPTAPIEGSPAACTGGPNNYQGDQHVLVLDRDRCMLYETFNSVYCSGAWSADSETIWDLQSSEQRPWGWTSADAAGLAIFPGLVRYDEVAAGAINHAIRFTMQQTKDDANDGYFVEPATHAAGTVWGVSNIMGMRIRLNASFDISGYSAANQVILTAMKQYGMILADNGGYFYFQGVPDPRWNDSDLENLDSIQSSNFEVVQMTPAFPGWDANTAPTGAPPTINSFTASPSTVAAGTPVTLEWSTSNDSYDYIDVIGGVHGGSVTTTPAATTTYTLNATNQYGRSTSQVTVTVH
jgi:fibronectin type 3 domain-containing protein